MNVFREYLDRNGESAIGFVRRSGIARNSVYSLYHGAYQHAPRTSTLKRVAELTGLPFERLYAEFVEPYEREHRARWEGRAERGSRQGDETL